MMFCEGALAALSAADPDQRRALVAPNCGEVGETLAGRDDVDAIHLPVDQCGTVGAVDWASVTADLDAVLTDWTVRDWQHARRAYRVDADGIIADYPWLTRGRFRSQLSVN